MKFFIAVLMIYIAIYYCDGARTKPSLSEFEEERASQPLKQLSNVQNSDDVNAETLRFETENNGVDKYSFSYDTSNGISRSEEGTLKETEDGAAIVVQGATSWTAPDGKRYEFSFNADETGYHPIFKLIA